jgi:hypothetical protein
MDNNHSTRHRAWSRADFRWLNASVAATACGIYVVNRIWLHQVSSNWFIHGYLNDILAGILILAYANLIIGLTPLFDRVIVSPSQIAIFITAAGCYWEFITPLYRQHTADAYNLVAYGFGAALYYAIIRVLPSMHLTNQ